MGKVIATDADSGRNALVKYRIIPSGSISTNFALYPNGGIVVLGKLDRETQDVYKFQIEAVDSGKSPLKASANVTVHVTDVNDCVPEFSVKSYNLAVDENMPSDTEIAKVKAADCDINENSRLKYLLNTNQSHVKQLINVDTKSGSVTTKGEFNFGKASSFQHCQG